MTPDTLPSNQPSATGAQHSRAVLSLIGNTPLLPLHFHPEDVTIYAKCEFLNPSGSIKDRLAKCVVLDAEQRGLLKPDSIILECTSGNTGIALAMVGAAAGYRVTILMSETASVERRRLIEQFGAEPVLFKSDDGYQTGIKLSQEMARRDERYFLPRQFENLINADDHEHSTGQEILNDDEVKVRSADALAMTRRLHRDFGLLVGTSSGANVFAALAVASKLGPDPTVVTILCDRAERYFSTRLFGAGTAAAQV